MSPTRYQFLYPAKTGRRNPPGTLNLPHMSYNAQRFVHHCRRVGSDAASPGTLCVAANSSSVAEHLVGQVEGCTQIVLVGFAFDSRTVYHPGQQLRCNDLTRS